MLRASVVAIGLLMVITTEAAAQTPHATTTIAEAPQTGGVGVLGASAANAWLGAQLGYKFGQSSDGIGDNLLVSASVIYDIPLAATRKIKLPVISNFADLVKVADAASTEEQADDKLKELMLSSSGVRAGLYPYRTIDSLSSSDLDLVVHGEASWKINGFKQEESDEINYLNQFRVAAGFELAVGEVGGGNKPLTISVTPVLTSFDAAEYAKVFNESKSHLWTVEVVAVLPIAARSGVLFEFVRGDVNSLRVGVILAGEK